MGMPSSLSLGGDKSAAGGGTINNTHNLGGGGFPFAKPNSVNDVLIYGGVAVILIVLIKKKGRK